MNKLITAIGIVCLFGALGFAQSDEEPRLCSGMPRNQMAFAQLLASGNVQNMVHNTLLGNPSTQKIATKLYHALFDPLPTSVLQLNGRIDQWVGAIDIGMANQLRNQVNDEVASELTSVHNDNIACSISLLSYREASDVFGKRIAAQYGVVQVTIRNTDPEHEFLLHQIDFWFGDTLQYYATRDRKIARGVAEKGQAVDPRNAAVRVIETVANVGTASTIPFGGNPQIGASIFNSTVVPGFKYIFPDLTVPQIARLDDMGFSAGASTMVIPKSGAISLVAFIPSDSVIVPKLAQYEQRLGPYRNPQTGVARGENNTEHEKLAEQLSTCDQMRRDATSETAQRAAPQLRQQIADCNRLMDMNEAPAVPNLSAESLEGVKGNSKQNRLGIFGKKHKNIGSFDPAVVLLLQKDLQILVAGSHIQQVPTQATIASLSCALPTDGLLVQGSEVNCTIAGTHLDLLKQAQLIGSTQSTEIVPSSKITQTKNDATEIKVTFQGCSFSGKVSSEYLLEWTNSRGIRQLDTNSQKIPPAPLLSCLPSGGKNYQCALQNLTEPAGTLLKLAPASGNAVQGNTAAPSAALTIPDGTYTVTVSPSGGKDLSLCAPVKVP